MREVWRIAPDARDYGADDLSGRGAEKTGGRWNRKGSAVLYCSSTIALACLETLVHLSGSDPLPLNRYLVRIAIPPSAWRSRAVLAPTEQVGWDNWGKDWIATVKSLITEVPSVIVPEESNILINPRHRDAKRLRARKVRRWTYDPRLQRSVPGAH
ncbi:MAG: RES family NAD+ phosphorylase [Steroidobacteraceae bacterium]